MRLARGGTGGSSLPLSLLKGFRWYHPLENFWNPSCLYRWVLEHFWALKCSFCKASFVLSKTDFWIILKHTFLLSPPKIAKFKCVVGIWGCTCTHCTPSGYAYGRRAPCGPLFDRTCWTWELHASKSAPVTVTCGGAHKSDMIAQCPPVVGVLRTAPDPISAAANGSGLVEQAGNSGAYRGAQWCYNITLYNVHTLPNEWP